MTEKQSFETALKQLEHLVAKLDEGDIGLDEAMKMYEQGTKLVKACQKELAAAEMKVEKIVADTGETEPFDSEA